MQVTEIIVINLDAFNNQNVYEGDYLEITFEKPRYNVYNGRLPLQQ